MVPNIGRELRTPRPSGLNGSGDVRLYTRRERDLTANFPVIVAAIRGIKARSLTVDGELVATHEGRASDFHALRRRRPTALTVVFDLLYLDGLDLRSEP